MATLPSSQYNEEHYKQTPCPHSYSQYSWNPSYDGSPWKAEDTARHINPTRAQPLSSHTTTTDTLMTSASRRAHYETSKYTGLQLETTKCEATGALYMGSGQSAHPKKPSIPPRTNQHNILPRRIPHHIPRTEQIIQNIRSTH